MEMSTQIHRMPSLSVADDFLEACAAAVQSCRIKQTSGENETRCAACSFSCGFFAAAQLQSRRPEKMPQKQKHSSRSWLALCDEAGSTVRPAAAAPHPRVVMHLVCLVFSSWERSSTSNWRGEARHRHKTVLFFFQQTFFFHLHLKCWRRLQ